MSIYRCFMKQGLCFKATSMAVEEDRIVLQCDLSRNMVYPKECCRIDIVDMERLELSDRGGRPIAVWCMPNTEMVCDLKRYDYHIRTDGSSELPREPSRYEVYWVAAMLLLFQVVLDIAYE